ncbi:MAG TPA: division/cell wall cluster transcriptional repressor MraZ [Candidatus Paceibacterota bacterium]|nr:division/cell wall cluster transcriptional repressor MraZ [Candidatus Paceibacterota bacterium]
MFIGEYTHTLDSKNRLSLPAKFRKDLGRGVVMTRGLDHCLFVYPKKEWAREAAMRAAHAGGTAAGRGLARLFLAGAMEAEVDTAGRVLVPDHLKSYAGLRAKAIVAGVADRVEIWDETAWKRYTASIERDADALAEKLGDTA